MTPPAIVTIPLAFTLAAAPSITRLGSISWNPLDPWTVHMLIKVSDGPGVPWMFGWELITAALVGEAGIGDVQIRPLRGTRTHEIGLSSPNGEAALLVASDRLQAFVDIVSPRQAVAAVAAFAAVDDFDPLGVAR